MLTSVSNRRQAITLVTEAVAAGARKHKACTELGISKRTLERWEREGENSADKRPTAEHPEPGNKLSAAEREAILDTCHQAEYASLPPSQIVPRLADQGSYLASESTFYRLLRAADEQHHRGRSHAPRAPKPLSTHCATGPNQVWSWDITWLPTQVRGLFFYLYLILDIYSRKIVGWEVYAEESSQLSSVLIQRTVLAEKCLHKPLILHSDNGGPMTGATMLEMLYKLGITPSTSRPRVSNDNAYSEAIFRTCKYRPEYPTGGFADIGAARQWVLEFVRWYNEEHRHSGIRFVTPVERHRGEDKTILAQRHIVYEQAKAKHPERWSGKTRNWEAVGEVWLNPEKRGAQAIVAPASHGEERVPSPHNDPPPVAESGSRPRPEGAPAGLGLDALGADGILSMRGRDAEVSN